MVVGTAEIERVLGKIAGIATSQGSLEIANLAVHGQILVGRWALSQALRVAEAESRCEVLSGQVAVLTSRLEQFTGRRQA